VYHGGTAADAWGIADGYEDTGGEWRQVGDDTRAALLAAMGCDADDPTPPATEPVRVVRTGTPVALDGPGELTLEDGTSLGIVDALPADLPPGYHDLRPVGGRGAFRVIATPGRCPLPPRWPAWGWAVQLYAARSRGSWGIGDLADLARVGRWAAGLGAEVVLVNPLHAPLPVLPQEASPYFPSSRRFQNPLYVRVEEAPGAAEAGLDLEPLAAAGRALNAERRIDRDAVFRLKLEALARLWARGPAPPAFDRFIAAQGRPLDEFATFCALAEHHGGGWRRWPPGHRRPESAAVARFAAERRDRVRFHQWVQWLLDEQLARAGAGIALVQDLPIGVDPDGADAWAWQDVLATGVTVGAPPDRYNARGQDWGLPPFIPARLRAAAYGPVIETLRATLRHAGGIRIDHVMGLFRLFWIPGGQPPAAGGFVRYAAEELLAIVAIESHRAGAFVVGEDLGTVERGVRERLAEHGVLSYRLVWFETDRPARYPELALAAVTTHDLPTVAGLWTGADLIAQQRIGLHPDATGPAEIRDRVCQMTGLPPQAPAAEAIARVHQVLAEAPSMIVTATLEDALAVEERPNMPGTVGEWPNWSLALPVPLEALEEAPLARAVAAALGPRRAPDTRTGGEVALAPRS
jgi:4-alpha-glucanotransferase